MRFYGGSLPILRHFGGYLPDFFPAPFEGPLYLFGADPLECDGVRAEGRSLACDGRIFAIIVRHKAVRDRASICSDSFKGVFRAAALRCNRACQILWRRPRFDLRFCDIQFPCPQKGILLGQQRSTNYRG